MSQPIQKMFTEVPQTYRMLKDPLWRKKAARALRLRLGEHDGWMPVAEPERWLSASTIWQQTARV